MKFTKEEKMAFVNRYQDGETVLSICNENQIPRSTFYRWIQDYQQTVTDAGTAVTPQEFLYMKRRIGKLEDMIQVLKTVSCTVSSPLQEKLKAIMGISRASAYELVHTPGFPAVRSGRLIKISKKAFFNWLDSGGNSQNNKRERKM